MALTFGSKARYYAIIEAFRKAGHPYRVRDGKQVYNPANESAMQAIIDAFDEVQGARDARIDRIRNECMVRVRAIFPALDSADAVDLEMERWRSLGPGAQRPTPRYAQMLAIAQAARAAIVDVNAADDIAAIDAITVAWP